MTRQAHQFIPGIYRQHILAGVVIAGHQPVGIDTHGGGPAPRAATSPPPSGSS